MSFDDDDDLSLDPEMTLEEQERAAALAPERWLRSIKRYSTP